MKQRLLSLLVLAAFGAATHAKIPAPTLDDAAKAKAAETAARAAWQAKVDAYQLCKAQDRVAARYKGVAAKADPKGGKPASAAQVAAKPASAAAVAAKPASAAVVAAKPASAPQAAASGTPAAAVVAAAPPAPCVDPGAFAWNPPEQKPLEAAGAHSPSGTAASPPSVRPEAAQMAPSKAGVAPAAGGASAARKS